MITKLDLAGFVVGFCLFEYGLTRWSVPAALMIGGLLLMGLALWPSPRRREH